MKPLLKSLVLLAVCVFLAFLPTSHPLYDMTPSDGDESMSLSQAYNSVHMRTPAYGYTADTKPWTPGLAILPAYFAVYGPVVAVVPPLRRIPVARLVSRVLVGLALFVAASTVLRRRRGRKGPDRRDGRDEAISMGAAASLVFAFCTVETFVEAGSFGRVDAVAIFSVALFGYFVRRFLEERSDQRLLLAGACATAALFSSYLAGAICALDLVALALFHMATPFEPRKVRRTLLVGLKVLGGALAAFVFLHFVVLHGGIARNDNQAFNIETDLARTRLGHIDPESMLVHLTRFPGVLPLLLVFVGGSMLVASGVRRTGARDPSFGLFFLRLAMVALAVHFVPYRAVYTPVMLCAMLVPFLDTIAHAPGARLRRALVVAALPLVIFAWVPNVLARTPEKKREDQVNAQLNARRDAHIASLFAFLDREHVENALTTDPLFTILDGEGRHFLFIYAAELSGSREVEVLRRFMGRFGVRYLVTSGFGDAGFVNYLGLQGVRSWTAQNRRGATDLRYPDGSVLHIEEVFQSTAPDIPPGKEYGIGTNPTCTPFFVYRLELVSP